MSDPRTSRQQKRQHVRALLDLGRKALTMGLPHPSQDTVWLGAGLLIHKQLKEPGNVNAAADGAEIAHRLLERTMAKVASSAAIACAKGCNFCCHNTVAASAPEVFSLARAVRKMGPRQQTVAAAVAARHHITGTADIGELARQFLPCALLVEGGGCGLYATRPLPCRRVLSLSAEACAKNFAGEAIEIPLVEEGMVKGDQVASLLLGAIQSAGLDASAYELVGALDRALTQPDAEPRWLAGEDVFTGLLTAYDAKTSPNRVVTHWAERLKALVD